MAKIGRWLGLVATALLLGLLLIAAVRWIGAWKDLNQPARRTAWEQLQRHGNLGYVIWEKEQRENRDFLTPRFDPGAAMLWLAAGFDANGDFCAEKGKAPDAFA